jgi:hypothetical protein
MAWRRSSINIPAGIVIRQDNNPIARAPDLDADGAIARSRQVANHLPRAERVAGTQLAVGGEGYVQNVRCAGTLDYAAGAGQASMTFTQA